MITGISIENFKGIRERVEVKLKPLTLLFGPNSAGKSTILHALHYAREIFERRNLSPDRTIAGGEFVDLGGFDNFVHGHDTQKTVYLRLDLDLDHNDELVEAMEYGPSIEPVNEYLRIEELLESYAPGFWFPCRPSVEIGVSWSDATGSTYVSSYKLYFSDKLFAEITSDPQGKRVALTTLEANHPSISRPEVLDMRESYESGTLEELFVDPSETLLASCLREVGASFQRIRGEVPDGVEAAFEPMIITGQKDALPLPRHDVTFAMDESWDTSGYDQSEKELFQVSLPKAVADGLSHMLTTPLEIVREFLTEFRYLGPLRDIPERRHTPPRHPDPSRWASGLGCWDLLETADDKFLDEVSGWLGDEDRLDAGYHLQRRRYKELDVSDPLVVKLLTGRAFDEADEEARLPLGGLPTHSRIAIVPKDGDIELGLHDVGTGISQVVPVIVTVLADKHQLLAIDQPELLLHPRLQAELGDLFIEAAMKGKRNFLIETHSEHLVLRLLRRIRETSDGELPSGHPGLRPEDISVIYLERGESGTQVHRLRIDETGDFVDRWPKGFFEERAKELF